MLIVTVGRDVRSRAAVAAKIAEATRYIAGGHHRLGHPELASAHLVHLLDQRLRTLLELDDVWSQEQLSPFLRGAMRAGLSRLPVVSADDLDGALTRLACSGGIEAPKGTRWPRDRCLAGLGVQRGPQIGRRMDQRRC